MKVKVMKEEVEVVTKVRCGTSKGHSDMFHILYLQKWGRVFIIIHVYLFV